MVTLADQIVAFKQQLAKIREDHGSSWAVFVNSQVEAAFPDFQGAATYALANFPDDQFLIRHTDEQPETIPFVLIEG